MTRAVDVVAPPRLGGGFRWLLGSFWTANLADGIAIAAGPLLVASQTRSELLIALGATVQWLPPLLFGLIAGVVTDRVDRRRLVMTVDTVRAALLLVLTVSVATGTASVGLVLLALFAVSAADVFATNASQTLLPMIVARDDLAVGNARLQTGFITLRQLAGPPLGAGLFVLGMAVPFAATVVLTLAAVGLVARVALPAHRRERTSSTVHRDVAEGVRFTARHPAVRTLVLTIFIFNVTFGAAWSVLVLYATRHLGLGAIGFGLVTSFEAAGGIAGVALYGVITRHVTLGNIMRVGLIIETLTHLGLATTSTPWVALTILFVFGMHAFVWATTSTTVRQRAVSNALQGRVNSVNTIGVFGGLVIGSGIGGLLAQHYGVTAPFWFAFAGSAVFLVLIWRQLAHIAHDDHPAAAAAGAQ